MFSILFNCECKSNDVKCLMCSHTNKHHHYDAVRFTLFTYFFCSLSCKYFLLPLLYNDAVFIEPLNCNRWMRSDNNTIWIDSIFYVRFSLSFRAKPYNNKSLLLIPLYLSVQRVSFLQSTNSNILTMDYIWTV